MVWPSVLLFGFTGVFALRVFVDLYCDWKFCLSKMRLIIRSFLGGAAAFSSLMNGLLDLDRLEFWSLLLLSIFERSKSILLVFMNPRLTFSLPNDMRLRESYYKSNAFFTFFRWFIRSILPDLILLPKSLSLFCLELLRLIWLRCVTLRSNVMLFLLNLWEALLNWVRIERLVGMPPPLLDMSWPCALTFLILWLFS